MKQILIVDDEGNMRTVLSLLFKKAGFQVRSAESGQKALVELERSMFDLVLTDLRMPVMDGMSLLEALRKEHPELPVVVITAYGTVEMAVDAMKKGAIDFIAKPFKNDEILHVVRRALDVDRLKQQNSLLQQASFPELIYRSDSMAQVMGVIQKVGPVSTPVLLIGESGVGKEVVARTIHRFYCGEKDYVPFVSINCPAVPEPLLESELFGYRKGAFTGATKDFKGKVRLADHGTLFLDEIGEMPMNIQPKLLRLLETKTVEPLGSAESVRISTRFICATNRDLKSLVKAGQFREDLYYRINTITVEVPPVRERRDDILALVNHFLASFSVELGKPVCSLSDDAREAMLAYSWPGNVREIKNVIERAVVLTSGSIIELGDLPVEFRSVGASAQPGGGGNRLEEIEKRTLQDALLSAEWNVSAAARSLGISRNTIRYRMQKHGLGGESLEPDDAFRSGAFG